MPSDQSDERWRQQVDQHPEQFNWLGKAREVIARGVPMSETVRRERSAKEFKMKADGTLIPVRGEIGYIPKPGRRTTDLFHNGSSGRDKTTREGHCRMCQKPRDLCAFGNQPATLTRHHLVPLRWFMRDGSKYRAVRNANANIVPLCWTCHSLIEDRDMIARRMLRKLLTQREVAFAVQLRGIGWLNAEYPAR